jgi:arylsulfatase A-like enzyme
VDYIDLFNDGMGWPVKSENQFSLGEPVAKFNRSRQQYDEYLAYVDFEFGRLLEMLGQAGTLDNTMLVVTSDHGELFERGLMGHLNSTLHQDLLQVLLLISLPNQSERYNVWSPTSCVDLLPTLLKFSGWEIPEFVQGEVLPGFASKPGNEERSIYAMEAKLSSKQDPTRICTLAMIKGRNKLIRYLGYEGELEDELYDLENDPGEMENLVSVNEGLAEEMGVELKIKLDQSLEG